MAAPRARRAPPADALLDWRDSSHWSPRPRPCRYCGRFTHLRDSKGSPAHKVCAEAALAQQAAEASESYDAEHLHP